MLFSDSFLACKEIIFNVFYLTTELAVLAGDQSRNTEWYYSLKKNKKQLEYFLFLVSSK